MKNHCTIEIEDAHITMELVKTLLSDKTKRLVLVKDKIKMLIALIKYRIFRCKLNFILAFSWEKMMMNHKSFKNSRPRSFTYLIEVSVCFVAQAGFLASNTSLSPLCALMSSLRRFSSISCVCVCVCVNVCACL